jgi:hypothetical protein
MQTEEAPTKKKKKGKKNEDEWAEW